MSENEAGNRICGVFSRKKVSRIGSGATSRRVETVAYFFVRELEGGEIEVQALDAADAPFGPVLRIGREELLAKYLPEPQKTLARAQAALSREDEEVRKAVARGDKFRRRGETFTAEYEYGKALSLDEGNVRANFGIGLCYIARGEREKAHEVFERLVTLDAAFTDEHKHLFNEFGISLRKSGMADEALHYYERALELAPNDENLRYNMARAAYEKGDGQSAAKNLAACLKLNPAHAEALRFVEHLKRKKGARS